MKFEDPEQSVPARVRPRPRGWTACTPCSAVVNRAATETQPYATRQPCEFETALTGRPEALENK